MIVPAFFVACSVDKQISAGRSDIDIVIVVPPGDVDSSHREFARSRGLIIDETMALDSVDTIQICEGRLSYATLMKLLLAGHFRDRYDKLLYLDADLTIHADVGGLFKIDVGRHALAAVRSGHILSDLPATEIERIHGHFAELGMTPPFWYFNSGVMLIQPDAWIATHLPERSLEFIRHNPQLCELPDEDGLNAVLDGDILELSPIWNARPNRHLARPFEPAIIHYAGPDKPWRRFGRQKRLGDLKAAYRLYQAFTADSPWPGFLRTQWNVANLGGSIWREVETLSTFLNPAQSQRQRARKKTFLDDLRRYVQEADFVDVEQGVAVREDGFIRCASRHEERGAQRKKERGELAR